MLDGGYCPSCGGNTGLIARDGGCNCTAPISEQSDGEKLSQLTGEVTLPETLFVEIFEKLYELKCKDLLLKLSKEVKYHEEFIEIRVLDTKTKLPSEIVLDMQKEFAKIFNWK